MYHVTGLSTGTSEDEDCLGTTAGAALLEFVPGAGAELTDFEGVCFWCGECDGRGCSQAGEHRKSE